MADTLTAGTPGTPHTVVSARPTVGRLVSMTAVGTSPTYWFGIDVTPEQARSLAGEPLVAAGLIEGASS